MNTKKTREYWAKRAAWFFLGPRDVTTLIYDGKKGWVSGYSQCQAFELVAQVPVTEDRYGLQSIVEVSKNQGRASIEAREKLMTEDQANDIRALIKALETGAYNVAPLKGGPSLKIEDLDTAVYEVPRHQLLNAEGYVPPGYRAQFTAKDAKLQGCPKCGHAGDFIGMALCCPEHGAFGGC